MLLKSVSKPPVQGISFSTVGTYFIKLLKKYFRLEKYFNFND